MIPDRPGDHGRPPGHDRDRTTRGHAVETGIAIASTDPLAADAVDAQLLGFSPQAVRHLWEAARLDLGESDTEKMQFPALGMKEAIDMDNWTLHDFAEDFSESVDLRDQFPDRLAELVEAFDVVAWANQVYPLDNRSRPQKLFDTPAWARELADEPRTYLPGMQTVIRADVMPKISDRSFRIGVRFSYRESDQGILWAIGDPIGGMVAFFLSILFKDLEPDRNSPPWLGRSG